MKVKKKMKTKKKQVIVIMNRCYIETLTKIANKRQNQAGEHNNDHFFTNIR